MPRPSIAATAAPPWAMVGLLARGHEERLGKSQQRRSEKQADQYGIEQGQMPDPAARGGLAGTPGLRHQHHRAGQQAGPDQHQEHERRQADGQIGQLVAAGPAGHHRVHGGHDQQTGPRDHHRRARRSNDDSSGPMPILNQTKRIRRKEAAACAAGHPLRGHRHRQPPQLIGALAPCRRMGGLPSDLWECSQTGPAMSGAERAIGMTDPQTSAAARPDGALRGRDARP